MSMGFYSDNPKPVKLIAKIFHSSHGVMDEPNIQDSMISMVLSFLHHVADAAISVDPL